MTTVTRRFSVTVGNSGRDLTVCEGNVRYTFGEGRLYAIEVQLPGADAWFRLSAIAADLFDTTGLTLADPHRMAEADREAAEFAGPVTIVTDPEGVA